MDELDEKTTKIEETNLNEITDAELKAKIIELGEKDEKERLISIEILRTKHPSKILNKKEVEILLTIKEEELTDEDKRRIKLTTLRLKHHKYSGKERSSIKNKKAKVKRKLANKSRKANR